MEDYQLRVLDERCDLYIKIIKLRAHLSSDVNYDVASVAEQLIIMQKYLEVLDKRIEGMI